MTTASWPPHCRKIRGQNWVSPHLTDSVHWSTICSGRTFWKAIWSSPTLPGFRVKSSLITFPTLSFWPHPGYPRCCTLVLWSVPQQLPHPSDITLWHHTGARPL